MGENPRGVKCQHVKVSQDRTLHLCVCGSHRPHPHPGSATGHCCLGVWIAGPGLGAMGTGLSAQDGIAGVTPPEACGGRVRRNQVWCVCAVPARRHRHAALPSLRLLSLTEPNEGWREISRRLTLKSGRSFHHSRRYVR